MRLKIILFSILITVPIFAEQGPLIWCRAEPVSTNGDDYLEYGQTEEEACTLALNVCQKQYQVCEITGCGEWFNEKSIYDNVCYFALSY